MPYITAADVKTRRNAIKAALPGFKFSIRCQDNAGISVDILSGPVDMMAGRDGYEQVNEFHLDSNYADRPDVLAVLFQINHICKRDLAPGHGHGDHYINIAIGQYDRPYQVKAVKAPKKSRVSGSKRLALKVISGGRS